MYLEIREKQWKPYSVLKLYLLKDKKKKKKLQMNKWNYKGFTKCQQVPSFQKEVKKGYRGLSEKELGERIIKLSSEWKGDIKR